MIDRNHNGGFGVKVFTYVDLDIFRLNNRNLSTYDSQFIGSVHFVIQRYRR